MTINHHLDDATILSYAAGTLGEALSVAAACHVSMCTECRTAVRKAEALGGEILDDLQSSAVSDVCRAATLASLDDTRAAKPGLRKVKCPYRFNGFWEARALPSCAGGKKPLVLPFTNCPCPRTRRAR